MSLILHIAAGVLIGLLALPIAVVLVAIAGIILMALPIAAAKAFLDLSSPFVRLYKKLSGLFKTKKATRRPTSS